MKSASWWILLRPVAGCLLGACLFLWSTADGADRKVRGEDGDGSRVERLYGIAWHKSVAAALAEARKGEADKPVFCLRVLGDLDGFM
jgi:hypothetical protein